MLVMLNISSDIIRHLYILFGQMYIQTLCPFFKSLFIYLFIFRESRREGKREGGKYQSITSHLCPDQEPNPQPKHLYWPGIELWPFAFQDDAQLTELYQPGFLCPFLIVICIYLYFAIELHEFLIYFGS